MCPAPIVAGGVLYFTGFSRIIRASLFNIRSSKHADLRIRVQCLWRPY
ncbi:hypothetical protein TVNIR_3383 [Thioalkalivibrio nitratireducens DSM 14787]|uniref:Uncharacterized protein n=1 Tax=Thioalkalivibrio nitratireducens (strain DSM 14787 / UNIQEM 213 / ALEN2) TaxID=1255043 RepID=L0DZJ4_THIND|nr:hypothetical protein TVNIR_3383 [Thioalkalivibrio nitratireducens DSM 14787]